MKTYTESEITELENKAIDLVEHYKENRLNNYEGQFNDYIRQKNKTVIEHSAEFDLKIGDTILFLNGYDVPMTTKILGFDTDGEAFLLWDCFWATLNLKRKFIKKVK